MPDFTWEDSQVPVSENGLSLTHCGLQSLIASLVEDRLESLQCFLFGLPGIALRICQDSCALEQRIDVNAGE